MFELILIDINDVVVLCCVIKVEEYFFFGISLECFLVNGEVVICLWIEVWDIGVVGYWFYIFYF